MNLKNIVDIDSFYIKTGDIKVNSSDLMDMFRIIDSMKDMLLSKQNTKEQEININILSRQIDLYKSKYVLIGDLRRQENLWFSLLKKMEFVQVDTNTKAILQELSLDYCIDYMREGIVKGISLDQATKLLEVTILNFGKEDVQRSLWGEYLSCKSKRENLLKDINKCTKDTRCLDL